MNGIHARRCYGSKVGRSRAEVGGSLQQGATVGETRKDIAELFATNGLVATREECEPIAKTGLSTMNGDPRSHPHEYEPHSRRGGEERALATSTAGMTAIGGELGQQSTIAKGEAWPKN